MKKGLTVVKSLRMWPLSDAARTQSKKRYILCIPDKNLSPAQAPPYIEATLNDRAIAPAFTLETASRDGVVDLAWLAQSHADPLGLWAALERRARTLGIAPAKSAPNHQFFQPGAEPVGPLQSREIPVAGFDIYHDSIARHLGAGQPALRWYERAALTGAGGWRVLSFDELHARCSQRAAWWQSCGVEPGAIVCVLLPFGAECVVSLLTALRMGVRVALLEPLGQDYLAHRLEALAPQHIATEPFHLRRIPDFAELALPPDDLVRAGPAYSHTYAPDEPCFTGFSPLRDDPITPVDTRASDAYLGALRDGLISFALRPGDHLAAPGFHTIQHQPALLLSALITGSAFVHIAEADAVREAALFHAAPLRSAGVTAAVRDAILAAGLSERPAWQHWFRNPEEPTDWEIWRDFVQACDLGETPMSNIMVEAASGGSLLWSPRRRSTLQLRYLANVAPAPGQPWTLLDFTRSGQPAVADVGVYAPAIVEAAAPPELAPDAAGNAEGAEDGEEAGDADDVADTPTVESVEPTPVAPQHMILARRGQEYLYGGAIEPRRVGRVYPAVEVLQAIADAPFVDGATVVAVSQGGSVVAHRFVLVVFTGAESTTRHDALQHRRVTSLEGIIISRLGDEFLPDRVVTFPLHARRVDGDPEGEVDHGWCQAQYLSGLLFRKAQTPIFQQLGAVRAAVRAGPSEIPIDTHDVGGAVTSGGM